MVMATKTFWWKLFLKRANVNLYNSHMYSGTSPRSPFHAGHGHAGIDRARATGEGDGARPDEGVWGEELFLANVKVLFNVIHIGPSP